jgi:WD40 repeat protein
VGGHIHVAFSHDGKRLITASHNALRAYDANTGKPSGLGLKQHGTPANWISALAVDPTGKWVFVGGAQGMVSVADARTLDRVAVFEWHLGVVWGLAVSADGSRLFSSGGDGCVKVWPVSTLLKAV